MNIFALILLSSILLIIYHHVFLHGLLKAKDVCEYLNFFGFLVFLLEILANHHAWRIFLIYFVIGTISANIVWLIYRQHRLKIVKDLKKDYIKRSEEIASFQAYVNERYCKSSHCAIRNHYACQHVDIYPHVEDIKTLIITSILYWPLFSLFLISYIPLCLYENVVIPLSKNIFRFFCDFPKSLILFNKSSK